MASHNTLKLILLSIIDKICLKKTCTSTKPYFDLKIESAWNPCGIELLTLRYVWKSRSNQIF